MNIDEFHRMCLEVSRVGCGLEDFQELSELEKRAVYIVCEKWKEIDCGFISVLCNVFTNMLC